MTLDRPSLFDSSSMVPAFLSRGPPVLQHPERVIPLSDCERFEPHFQPNVALAPIPSSAIAQLPPPVSSVHPQRRQHHHEHQHRHDHRSSSPDEKQELLSANVKLEKTSSPSQTAAVVDSYPLYYVSEDDQKEVLSAKSKKEEKRGEEEESSAAVTSSTVNVEPPPGTGEVGTSSPESDSDSDVNDSAAADLEERLMALEVPQEVIELARHLVSENVQLRRDRRSSAREISRLRSQLHMQKQEQQQQQQQLQTNGESEQKEDATMARAGAADSTEDSEETDASSLPSNNKESAEPAVLATNNESE